MKKYKFLFFLLLLVPSCTREFDIEVLSRKQVMVNGLLIQGLPVIITLQYGHLPTDTTAIILSNDTNWIENAYVELWDDLGNSVELEFKRQINYPYYPFPISGYYSDSLIPQAGHTYYLKVYVPGYDTIYSQTNIPYPPHVDTAYLSLEEREVYFYWLNIKFFDSCGRDYYWVYLSEQNHTTYDPASISGNSSILISDTTFNCSTHLFSVELSDMDSLVFFYRVNEDFGKYFSSYISQVESRTVDDLPNPFREPVIVYSNIINGIGIFAGASYPIEFRLHLKK